MITWMQTHKKWLIVTIWIATIAFVGAGFVGWGAYSYGKKQDEVAVVKDTPIKVKDIQEIYTKMFNQLNQMMGGNLDEATAEKLGLKTAAFQEALKEALIIQFAKDNGLYITDEELAQSIASIPIFQKDGKFDEKLYIQILKQKGLTPKEFENNVKKALLIQKISQAISLPSKKTTQDTLASYLLMEDKISIKTITPPKIEVTENEIKTFWEKNKDKYKSPKTFEIGIFYVPLNATITPNELETYYDEHKENYTDENGKILPLDKIKDKVKKDLLAKKTKKEAIITMKKLKNEELLFEKKDVEFNNEYLNNEQMAKLISSKFLKPVLTQKGWLIAKLYKINEPTPLSFEEAKELAKLDLIQQKKKELLIKLAKQELPSFKGKDIGFIGKDDVMKLKTMSVNDATTFITQLFNSTTPKGFVLLPNEQNPNKAVLFNITAQKLLDEKKYNKYKDMIINYSNKLKIDVLNKNLIEELKKLYQAQIKIYMKI